MEPITVKYKVLDPRARTPAYATSGSAAADLCAVLDEPLTVQPMQRVLVPTGLAAAACPSSTASAWQTASASWTAITAVS